MIKLSRDRCVSCGGCVPVCPEDALQIDDCRLSIQTTCTECGLCIPACPHGALGLTEPSALSEIRPADDEYDIAVIGGGPAGSTAAYFAASSGAKVLILEKKPVVGIPQLCAEGISTSGLRDVFPDVHPNWISAGIEGAILVSPSGRRLTVQHPKAGYILERRVFDRDLFAKAAQAGATTITSAQARSIVWKDDYIVGVEYEHLGTKRTVKCHAIIAADGIESHIARWIFPKDRLSQKEIHVAAQVVMAGVDVQPGYPEFHVGNNIAPAGYAWVFPKGEGIANVGLGINPSVKSAEGKTAWELLRTFINFRFGNEGRIIEIASGNVPTAKRLPKIAYRNVLFVGDAGRLTDPISGGGIATALLSGKIAGELAAIAIENKKPERIESALDEYSRLWDKAKGRQMAFYSRGKEVFTRLPDSELEGICDFIDEQFGHDSFDAIDIPAAIGAILRRKGLVWNIFKSLFPNRK